MHVRLTVMSAGFDILFSPGDAFTSEPIKIYPEILKLILRCSGVRRLELRLTIYRGQRPFNYGSGSEDPNVVFDGVLNEESAFEKIAQLLETENSDVHIGVTCGYDLLRWNNETCDYEDSVGTLTLEYDSPRFDGGHPFKLRGPYRIHFYDNKRIFTPRAVDLSRCPANPALLSKLIEYGRNIQFVEGLCREIANTFQPSYLAVVGEGEPVHPLNCHMVYHNRLSGFLLDVQKILQIHAVGGGYFYEDPCYDFDPPYKSLDAPYEDDLRSSDDAASLAERLDHFCSIMRNSNLNEIRLDDKEIYDIICSSETVTSEDVGGSVFLTRSFMGYLDEPYLKMLDWAVGRSEVSTSGRLS